MELSASSSSDSDSDSQRGRAMKQHHSKQNRKNSRHVSFAQPSKCKEMGFASNIHEHRFAKLGGELVDAEVEAKRTERRQGYVCLTCPTQHDVILKHARAERYKISAWFSHVNAEPTHCGGGESLLHLYAKYLLQSQVGRYQFMGSICKSCNTTTWVFSGNRVVEVEAWDAPYRYDAVLCEAQSHIAVMEVWNTHETDNIKQEHVESKGIVFAEFKADHIVKVLDPTMSTASQVVLENLKPKHIVCDTCERMTAWRAEVSTLRSFDRETLAVWEAALNQRARFLRDYRQRRWLEWCNEIALLQKFDDECSIAFERTLQTKKRKHEEFARQHMQQGFQAWEQEIHQLQKFDTECFAGLQKFMRQKQECSLAPNCGCHGFRRPDHLAVHRHEREHMRRLAWCIQHGRTPAHEHVHEAPGDDTQFVYGVPPWRSDGSVNPAGVYFSPDNENEQLWLRLEKEAQDAGWECPRCSAWIAKVPMAYKHGVEPWDWWFCADCKQKAVKPSQKVLKEQREAKACQRMESFAGFVGFSENSIQETNND